MTGQTGRNIVRRCLAQVRPDLDLATIDDHTSLIEEKIITSLQVLDLILHLENASGRRVDRTQLLPGSFRDIATIARVFIQGQPL